MPQETIITQAPEVQIMAEGLIRAYHPELLECTIAYLFTSAAASCAPRKCNPLLRYLASLHLEGAPRAAVEEGPDFLILVNVEEWDVLIPGQHEPFVDHRLVHIGREAKEDGGVRFVIQPHTIEEFDSVLKRFGLYSFAAKTIGRIMQPELDLALAGEATRMSNIKSMTLSTPGAEPETWTPEQWNGHVEQHTGV